MQVLSRAINKNCELVLNEIPIDATIVTDPPYGLTGENFDQVRRILKALQPRPMIIILDWRNSHLMSELNKCGELVWEYGWVSGGRAKAKFGIIPTHNTIHLIGSRDKFKFTGGSIIHRGPGLSSPRQCSFAAKSGHEHEKPVKLMEMLISGIVNPNLIVDPFGGSGTTAVAAKNLGLPYWTIEKSKKWHAVTKERLSCKY